MRGSPRLAGVIASPLLMLAACAHTSADTRTHPADAPPRWVGAAPTPGSVLSLYDGFAAVGVHDVHLDRGWRSRFVKLDEPADDLAILGPARWAVAHGQSGRVVVVDAFGPTVEVARFDPAPLRVETGDLNRDGTMDVVVAADGDRPILHLVHGQDDGFAAPKHVPLDPKGRRSPALLLVDLDREGSIDVVTGLTTGDRQAPVPDHLRVFRNTTHGELVDEWMARVRSPHALHAGDFDEDGLPDVLATGPEGAWLQISSGYGWLNTPEKISRGSITDGGLWDVDEDGHLDIVLLRADRAFVEVRRGVGAGRTAPVQRYDVGAGPVSVAMVRRPGETLLVSANAQDRSFTTVRVADTTSRRTDR